MPRPLIPPSTWTTFIAPPQTSAHPKNVQALIRRLRTPLQVQRWIHSLGYNKQETMRTFNGVVRQKQAHCLEAALAAATILEYHGYPPLILDLESKDFTDHTLFLYRHRGKFGAIAMSRDVGLYGRRPVYTTIDALVQSYAIPYIDEHAVIKAYGVLNLQTLKNPVWRTSLKNVWYVEEALRNFPHRKFSLSPAIVRHWRQRYVAFKKKYPNRQPDFYPGKKNWI